VIASVHQEPQPGGFGPALAAARVRVGLLGLILVLAVLAWWSTVDSMGGMDQAPGADLGTLGWFLGVWVVMMAAMMLPSVAPTVALYSVMTRRRAPLQPLVFTSGYLLTWAAAGLLAFAISQLARDRIGGQIAWESTGRWVAGAILIVAAAYEVTPLKDACLRRCRSPLGYLLGSWRDGPAGALRMGAGHGLWCVGCCWGLMAALFALGVMNIAWMAFVAALIAGEKALPWARVATYGTATILLVLGVLVVAAPEAIPGFTIPSGSSMGM
jgi:predicted metal-binding membrane protein